MPDCVSANLIYNTDLFSAIFKIMLLNPIRKIHLLNAPIQSYTPFQVKQVKKKKRLAHVFLVDQQYRYIQKAFYISGKQDFAKY